MDNNLVIFHPPGCDLHYTYFKKCTSLPVISWWKDNKSMQNKKDPPTKKTKNKPE